MISKSFVKFAALSLILAGTLQANAGSCVSNERDVHESPKVEKFVSKMGGIANLEGVWKLSGTAAIFKKVVITFKSAADGLKAQIRGIGKPNSEFGEISVCETQNSSTVRVNAPDAEKTLYMRAIDFNTIQLAEISNGKVGSFYSFEKE